MALTNAEKQRRYRDRHHDLCLLKQKIFGAVYGPARKLAFSSALNLSKRISGCEDCGDRDGYLVYHHTDPDTKKYDVSRLAGYSLTVISKEIAKCVVLCQSCHRIRHNGGASISV